MFEKEVYVKRREELRKRVKSGLILMLGNTDTAFNYPANPYSFRQDSNFLYFFGIKKQDFSAVMDIEAGEDHIYADDFDLDGIIWMGKMQSVKEQSERVGVSKSFPVYKLDQTIKTALEQGRKIHFLPTYRAENKIKLEALLGIPTAELHNNTSGTLIKAVVSLREIKEQREIDQMDQATDVAYLMHTTAMKMAKPGVREQEIAGVIEGLSISMGGPVSFPVILSQDVHIIHNHYHGNILEKGRLMVTDAGHENAMNYTSDITRTIPVGGKFSQKQKEIYEIVLAANENVRKGIKPGIFYRDMHLLAARTITEGLKSIGLMKGDVDQAIAAGAHALFYPHGLGHMIGLDVHDMEGLGEDFVGYDETVSRSEQFGFAFLRLAKKLQPGNILTNEPGIYFIHDLIDLWKSEKKHSDFINYDKVEQYRDFSGIRIEDNILVTENGNRIMGKQIPKTVKDIEDIMQD